MIHTPIFGRSPVQTSYDSDAVAAQVLKARRGMSCGYRYQVAVTVALQAVTRTHLIFLQRGNDCWLLRCSALRMMAHVIPRRGRAQTSAPQPMVPKPSHRTGRGNGS